jgi:hypothetical protein
VRQITSATDPFITSAPDGTVANFSVPWSQNGQSMQAGTYIQSAGFSWYPLELSKASFDASKITTGMLPVARIPNLDASKITTGSLNAARIPNLDASKITTGSLNAARIPNLDASKITTGTLPENRLPSAISASRISGTLTATNIPTIEVSRVSGYIPVSRVLLGESQQMDNHLNFNPQRNYYLYPGGPSITIPPSLTLKTFTYAEQGMTVAGQFFANTNAVVQGTLEARNQLKVTNMNGTTTGAVYWNNSTKQLYRSSSSQRYKDNIRDWQVPAAAVLELQPKKFTWKPGTVQAGEEDTGLIAEEVAKSVPDLVAYDESGRIESVKYDKLSLYLLGVAKEQQKQIEELKAEVQALKEKP